jgi:hypothetical protein
MSFCHEIEWQTVSAAFTTILQEKEMIARYTRPEMGAIWNDENRYTIWLEIETLATEKPRNSTLRRSKRSKLKPSMT